MRPKTEYCFIPSSGVMITGGGDFLYLDIVLMIYTAFILEENILSPNRSCIAVMTDFCELNNPGGEVPGLISFDGYNNLFKINRLFFSMNYMRLLPNKLDKSDNLS